jgi:type II secretory pathway component GspD/PulD (secretin)
LRRIKASPKDCLLANRMSEMFCAARGEGGARGFYDSIVVVTISLGSCLYKKCFPDVTVPILRLAVVLLFVALPGVYSMASTTRRTPQTYQAAVFNLQVLHADQVEHILHTLYPLAKIRAEGTVNAVIVVASDDDITAMRSIVAGIDVKNPFDATVDSVQVHSSSTNEDITKLRPLYKGAHFLAGPNRTIIVEAAPQIVTQIRTLISQLDTPPASPTPRPVFPTTIVRVTQGDVRAVARAAARAAPNVSVAVSGSSLVLRGTPEDVNAAKAIVTQLDQPMPGARYVTVYRLSAIDAASVASLLSRSFHDADVGVDKDLNALSVTATAQVQQRIADAIAQLDVAPGSSGSGQQPGPASGGPDSEVISLHAAVPGTAGNASTSATDIAQTVSQALSSTAPDLKITVQPNSTRLVLTGSERSIALAKDLIAKLDVAEPLVELDTEVLEVDEGVQKQLGFKFPTPALSTTFSEIQPATTASGTTPQLLRLQAITRTPLSLSAQLDFLVSENKARILEDPRITTFSGRTASLRAGETVNILTTTGGGTGTVATTQVQSFQTGVTLDITPVVNADDYVTITLHPSVNSIAGVSAAGVPNIQNRDTTTTIGLHDGETIVVGGLIEDQDSRTVQKVPILGDLPLIGKLFQDVGVDHTRNELIVTVTPHILKPGMNGATLEPSLPAIPSPEALPTLAATATLPPGRTAAVPTVPQPSAALESPAAPPTSVPSPAATAAAPAALPTAFGQTNTFTYGAAPSNNFADANAPPQIFYIQAQPTVVKDG